MNSSVGTSMDFGNSPEGAATNIRHEQAVSEPVAIFVVIVLYQMFPMDAVAFQSLLRSADALSGQPFKLSILLYDNTAGNQPHPSLPDGVVYVRARENLGLAPAYNYALERAQAERCSWLLTLDQDTQLPGGFLQEFSVLARQVADDDRIAAVVPKLMEGQVVQSPLYIQWWRPRRIPLELCGIPDREITAMNSGTMWKVPHLRALGGFRSDFWLDYLDHALFRQTFELGKTVYVARDVRLEHRMSLADWKTRMSPERLASIFMAESAFNDIYKGWVDRFWANLKLALLFVSRTRKREKSEYLIVIWRELSRRLFRSRESRTRQWRELARARMQRGG